ncbi:MAG: outer membrane beta-barrel protein, partial [Kiritimatiellia bacterium]|nr:outer membrane beta-barrel protein [Kiritimatiellia bacterium]
MKKASLSAGLMLFALMASSIHLFAESAPKEEQEIPPWYMSIGGGYINFEGDEATKDSAFIQLKLGYDYDPRWSFEGSFLIFPKLDRNDVYDYDKDGVPHPRKGLDGDSTWALGIAGDALFHLIVADDRHWDPYLLVGVGGNYFQREREDAWRVDPIIRYGGG